MPAAPTGLTVTATTVDSITLTWNASTGATEYFVYMGTSSGGEATNNAKCTTTGPICQINGLSSGTTYFFYVVANNVAGTSGQSNEVSATPGASTTAFIVRPPPGPSRSPVLLAAPDIPVPRARGPGV